MCGIVGLFLKDKALEPQLGGLVAGMLATMCDRGPDSAGFAVYGDSQPDRVKLTLRGPSPRRAAGAGGEARHDGGDADRAGDARYAHDHPGAERARDGGAR